jgi:ectoine hydroxylase-related dioxygenase (phytanoyl-CoA dioxygenase family)
VRTVSKLEDFAQLVALKLDLERYPHASAIDENILIYNAEHLQRHLADPHGRRRIQEELVAALMDGPGIVVFRGAFPDEGLLDRATAAFEELLSVQRQGHAVAGDHFGQPGVNERLWNAAEKLALNAPDVFVGYYANDIVALVCQAWLGPVYQVTSQVNVVNPGGQAQVPHADYHLGFVGADVLDQYLPHVHRLSPVLTLQGAVAHCDMPTETGPTMYLPNSQRFPTGFSDFLRPEFIDFFQRHYVQLPLAKGDAAFFNPALYHGAGTNRSSSVRRMANLLQVSSPFGRAMESVARESMSNAVFPALLALRSSGADERAIHNAVVATADGYPFPTNLDRDQPVDGLAPTSQVDVLLSAVTEAWGASELAEALRSQADRRTS